MCQFLCSAQGHLSQAIRTIDSWMVWTCSLTRFSRLQFTRPVLPGLRSVGRWQCSETRWSCGNECLLPVFRLRQAGSPDNKIQVLLEQGDICSETHSTRSAATRCCDIILSLFTFSTELSIKKKNRICQATIGDTAYTSHLLDKSGAPRRLACRTDAVVRPRGIQWNSTRGFVWRA